MFWAEDPPGRDPEPLQDLPFPEQRTEQKGTCEMKRYKVWETIINYCGEIELRNCCFEGSLRACTGYIKRAKSLAIKGLRPDYDFIIEVCV